MKICMQLGLGPGHTVRRGPSSEDLNMVPWAITILLSLLFVSDQRFT